MLNKRAFTFVKSLNLLRRFCAYQERSEYEVLQKMEKMEIPAQFYAELLSTLRTEKYLNNERFAYEYAYGKFSNLGWGKTKILIGLRKHAILENEAENAVEKAILPNEYVEKLSFLLTKKKETLDIDKNSPLETKQKMINYALQKGYELDIIYTVLNGLSMPE